ncbi:exostosin family protein [Flavobacterium jejuense]|uniref:Exostosin family protein n=1 Tax=Flavobacterium jejuense TaxID=1544455 RepID=A0ABX0IWL9_9FLAO|nr:exostosin family protein [Flavobacterium jejuense]NHN26175.1 exostosin family protein [Flavobacterium jejuense]
MLTRPFYKESNWCLDSDEFEKQNLLPKNFQYELDINSADIVLIPFSIPFYFTSNKRYLLEDINRVCKERGIKAYGFIGGDFGIELPDFSNIIYYRQGGFKSQLSEKNKGFIVGLSDHFQRLFLKETITPSEKKQMPTIGFCGHATFSLSKRAKEIVKCLLENGKRFKKNPLNKVYEPIFASAYERAKLLTYFEKSVKVKTNFIYRENYRGGAFTEKQRTATTLEYYNNILESDYVLCLRGAGNFSVRFYETLMLGKIPIFVNTDCLLPFEDKINWKNHVVWVEWKDRKNIAQRVADFHAALSTNEFVHLQISNRELWKETLSVEGILEMISNDL